MVQDKNQYYFKSNNRIINNKEIVLANSIGLKFNPLYIDDCIQIINYIVENETSKSNILNIAGPMSDLLV